MMDWTILFRWLTDWLKERAEKKARDRYESYDWFKKNGPKNPNLPEFDVPAPPPRTVNDDPPIEKEEPMKNFRHNITAIISEGHGATNPLTDEYEVLVGGKEYTFPDGLNVREGDLNRVIGSAIIKEALTRGYNTARVSHDYKDYTLDHRHELTKSYKDESCLICVHCNASPKHNAGGFEVFTTRGDTDADKLAEYIWFKVNLLRRIFPEYNTRHDMASDGDHDKEANFREIFKFEKHRLSIQQTGAHAYLECGFFDYMKDYKLLTNSTFINLFANAVVDGMDLFYKNKLIG